LDNRFPTTLAVPTNGPPCHRLRMERSACSSDMLNTFLASLSLKQQLTGLVKYSPQSTPRFAYLSYCCVVGSQRYTGLNSTLPCLPPTILDPILPAIQSHITPFDPVNNKGPAGSWNRHGNCDFGSFRIPTSEPAVGLIN
jgi:hypothetical protein